MTNFRLHISSSTNAVSFDDQAADLLRQVTPASANVSVTCNDEAWALAQYVDLLDAGYGSKGLVYRAARMCLANYVRATWQQPAQRGFFGRAACLSAMVNKQLDAQMDDLDAEFSGVALAA